MSLKFDRTTLHFSYSADLAPGTIIVLFLEKKTIKRYIQFFANELVTATRMANFLKLRLNLLQLAVLYAVFRFIEKSVKNVSELKTDEKILPPYKKREIHLVHYMHAGNDVLQNKEIFEYLL